jgi:hypothetical protein
MILVRSVQPKFCTPSESDESVENRKSRLVYKCPVPGCIRVERYYDRERIELGANERRYREMHKSSRDFAA